MSIVCEQLLLINHCANDKWQRTNGHEGLGVSTGLRDSNAVDCKHPHLIEHTLDHFLRLVRGGLINIEVELGPSGRADLLPLHQVPWREQQQRWHQQWLSVLERKVRKIKRGNETDRLTAVLSGDRDIRCEHELCVSGVPLTGTPPSNAGGSHVITALSSPTDVHLTFSGGLGTSGEAGYRRQWEEALAWRNNYDCSVWMSDLWLCFMSERFEFPFFGGGACLLKINKWELVHTVQHIVG